MTSDPTKLPDFDQAWGETIERDHHAIKEIVGRMESTTDLHRLLPILEELRAALVDHFAHEEAPDGLHELIASMSPETVATLQNVLCEHQDFLRRLDGLIECVQACLAGPLADVLEGAASLAASLRDHEARETVLFTDAVFTDLGRV